MSLAALTFDQIASLVKRAMPSKAVDICIMAQLNTGRGHAQALMPVTKFLTLGLDDPLQTAIETALLRIEPGATNDIKFIKASPDIDHDRFLKTMWALTPFMSSLFPNYKASATINYNKLWHIFNDECKRDGLVFLQKAKAGFATDSIDESAETFLGPQALALFS